MKNLKKIYHLTLWTILFAPSLVFAWKPGDAIVPDCARVKNLNPKNPGCHFPDIMTLIETLLDVFIWIAIPISTVLFAWIGFDFIVKGDKAGARNDAKKRLTTLLWGMLFTLAPVLIVKIILSGLGAKSNLTDLLN